MARKVNLILGIRVLEFAYPVSERDKPEYILKDEIENLSSLLQKWFQILAIGGKIVIYYEHPSDVVGALFPDPEKIGGAPFNITIPDDIQMCTTQLKEIASRVESLKLNLDTTRDAHARLQNRHDEVYGNLPMGPAGVWRSRVLVPFWKAIDAKIMYPEGIGVFADFEKVKVEEKVEEKVLGESQ